MKSPLSNTEEKTVSVQLNGEESTMEFLDLSYQEVDLDRIRVDAYVVVFSVAHRDTFAVATDTLKDLRNGLGTDRAVLLVGNKTDLVRKRKISNSEARQLATHFDCKYIETSVVLNHNIDELLVGILKQIRLKLDSDLRQESPQHSPNRRNKAKRDSLSKPKELLRKIFKKYSRAVKSCDNLYRL
ncbi:hypothetical protein ScPMuIL_001981 [Solemya velum]